MKLNEQIPSKHHDNYERQMKKIKRRTERRRAKQNPETTPAYGKYRGYSD
jgi:hypothetical protein